MQRKSSAILVLYGLLAGILGSALFYSLYIMLQL
jgi:hypothetical protein